ncbi:small ribosomal subunit protein mS33-like [Dysidea avara]|uniref:small ribosomal subunit protein mS33-like n=1 Tax=Dysidea avara TaxID=196820 RepID=UPI00333257F8
MSKQLSRIGRLSRRIFGDVPRELSNSEKKVVDIFARRPKERDVLNFYPESLWKVNRLLWNMRQLGLYRDEHWDFRQEMATQRKVRGKGREKGDGKRSGKRRK